MGEIVNLRMARKRKARAEDATTAEQNRALHGRSRTEKQADARTKAREAALLDGHRIGSIDKDET